MRQGFPIATAGLKVGLLGGSFDPAHAGHAHITREALKRLGLDQVWWLVSPGNPLKRHQPAQISDRIAQARQVIRDPRVKVTALEQALGTRFTCDTLVKLQALYPGVEFVWLMGADNLASFHRWDRWQEIMALVRVAVFARPKAGIKARCAPMAHVFAASYCPRADQLLSKPTPAWTFVNLPMNTLSSSFIRAQGGWGQAAPVQV